jgi:hypothetical protein
MTKQGSMIDGSANSGAETAVDGEPLIFGEEVATEIGTDWTKEIEHLKVRQYRSIDDAIGDIADVVIKKLKLPASVELRNHIIGSLLDDEGLQEVITRELIVA